jgi:catechol 2,3-dioxygenase-like lactoylglutathione lyase family enzyme
MTDHTLPAVDCWIDADGVSVRNLARIDLVSADPDRLAAFYGALGFDRAGPSRQGPDGDRRLDLGLGEERIGLIRPVRSGAPYPPSVPGWSPYFQHIAIVVGDMADAYAQLRAATGWTAISTEGPQRLPAASGGVTAFKFRDPEGHPLELIAFPPDRTPDRWLSTDGAKLFLGIDHSAVSVADTGRSIDAYEQLGLKRTSGSLNIGAEQGRLDDVSEPVVEVTALSLARQPTPHVELLCYRGDFNWPVRQLEPNDIAATRLVFEMDIGAGTQDRPAPGMLRDPDGHLIVLEAPGPGLDADHPPVTNPG